MDVWVVFRLGLFQRKLPWMFSSMSFDGHLYSFFLGACLEVGLLNHRLGMGLALVATDSFPK